MRYGLVLKHYIDEAGISNAELARRVGIGRSQITDWIKGATKEPGLTRGKQIADALGVDLNEMLDMMLSDES